MRLFCRILYVVLLAGTLAGCAGGGGGSSTRNEIYVAASGSDSNAGTKQAPYATLERARDEIRSMKRAGGLPKGGVTIWLREGTYPRSTTFLLSPEDSGSADSPVAYRACDGETVRLSGGITVKGFSPVANPDVATRFDPTALPSILQANVAALIPDIDEVARRPVPSGTTIEPAGTELFFDGRPMTLAHWPNEGWATIVDLPTGNLSGRFTYDGDRPSRWSRFEGIILYGFWAYDWFANYERVLSIDTAQHQIQTGYVPPPNPYGFRVGQRYMAINILEELDHEGEWYLDRETGILYFWPPGDPDTARVTLSLLDEPLVKLDHVSHVTLEGLTLEDSRGCGVEMSGGDHNLVSRCSIRNIGTVGVAIGGMVADILWQMNFNTPFSGNGGSFNGVSGCEIYNTGLGGILLGGGDRMTLTAGNNFATDNRIYDYSRLARTDRPAIFLYGVGNRVANNVLHDGPDLAVAFWGNDHLIEYNEIHDVCLLIDDAGALKTGRDYSQRGTVIRFNYIHDLVSTVDGGRVAVYLDDFQSGTTIFGNIFHNVNVGVNVGGGRDNLIENNIFFGCSRSIHVDARGLTWAKYYFDGSNTVLFDRLAAINYTAPPFSERYPELPALRREMAAVPQGNRIVKNIVAFSRAPTLIEGAEDVVALVNNLVSDAPGFYATDPPDFRLRDDSPAWGAGFTRIPVERIGITAGAIAGSRRCPPGGQ